MDTTKGPFVVNAPIQAGALDARHPSVRNAQQVYGRLVSSWASDVMSLRKRGLDVPTHRVPETPVCGAAIADPYTLRAA